MSISEFVTCLFVAATALQAHWLLRDHTICKLPRRKVTP